MRHNSNKYIFSVLYEQGLKQLELQALSVTSMESKTGSLMTGEGVILTILVTFKKAEHYPSHVKNDMDINWSSPYENLGTIVADVTRGKQDKVQK